MRKLLLTLCFMALPAMAADVSVTWTQPTANTDNSAIPATGAGSIASNRVEWGPCAGGSIGSVSGSLPVTPARTNATVPGLAPGDWCFRVYATNTYGSESAASNVASRTVVAPTPKPPVVTQATIARLWKRGLQQQVGRVDMGVACGELVADTRKADWYTVPRDSVHLNKQGRKLSPGAVIVAKCG